MPDLTTQHVTTHTCVHTNDWRALSRLGKGATRNRPPTAELLAAIPD